MAKQTFTTGQVLTAAQMTTLQTNDFNLSVSTQTANYTLAAADKGTREVMNMSAAGTVTVPNSTFDAGDAVWLHSIGSGTITVAAGAGLTLNSSAGTAPTLAQWEGGVVYFTSASAAIFFRGGGTTYGVATGGTDLGVVSVGGTNYQILRFTSDANLTVTKAGLFDILLIGGGAGGAGGGASSAGAGGGGGDIVGLDTVITVYLAATTHAVDVGAGSAAGTSTGGLKSSLAGYVAIGGGRAGGNSARQDDTIGDKWGGTGASGGGQTGNLDNITTSAMGVKGNNGGYGGDLYNNAGRSGGGGGGAGSAGGNASGTTGGNGGNGADITGWLGSSYVASAGGGGGGTTAAGSAGTGGVAGKTSGTGNAGVNYGAGGGGTVNASGGAGGAGAVYVRFKV